MEVSKMNCMCIFHIYFSVIHILESVFIFILICMYCVVTIVLPELFPLSCCIVNICGAINPTYISVYWVVTQCGVEDTFGFL